MKSQHLEQMKKTAAEECNFGAIFSLMFALTFIFLLICVSVVESVTDDHSPWWFSLCLLGYVGGMALFFFIYHLIKKRELRALEDFQTITRPLP